jgi:hypothetical protein
MPHHFRKLAGTLAAVALAAGKNLVQEACSGTTGSEVVWNLVPATQSPDPNNQFMLISTNVWPAAVLRSREHLPGHQR